MSTGWVAFIEQMDQLPAQYGQRPSRPAGSEKKKDVDFCGTDGTLLGIVTNTGYRQPEAVWAIQNAADRLLQVAARKWMKQ